jgi:citrate lyase subunit beta/citryl-CoA lyase
LLEFLSAQSLARIQDVFRSYARTDAIRTGVFHLEPIMRSALLLQAETQQTLLWALRESGADYLIIDLIVAASGCDPAELRKAALGTLLHACKSPAPKILIRINPLDTAASQADLESLMPGAPYGILLPHCHDGAAVQHLGGQLAVLEARNNLADGSTKIIGCTSSAANALFSLQTFQQASRRLEALSWSPEDLAASLGIRQMRLADGAYVPSLALARALTLFAAKAAHVFAIEAASSRPLAADAFQQECETAQRDGFDGKIALDPAQLAIINAVFSA